MADRPTTELITGNRSIKAVLREWITFAEYREIMTIYMKAMKVQAGAGGGSAEMTNDIGDTAIEAQNLAIKHVLVSLDGSTDNLLERLKGLPNDDAQEIVAAIEAISSPKKK